MLSLDDPQWAQLHTHSSDATWVPGWLARLRAAPDELELFGQGFYGLWSDENTWSAAFATAPHLIEIASRAGEQARLEYIVALGTIAAYRDPPGTGSPYGACPPDLEAPFSEALRAGLAIAGELLTREWGERETAMLI